MLNSPQEKTFYLSRKKKCSSINKKAKKHFFKETTKKLENDK